jgi:Ca2+-binding RTX toxin-like protein
MFAGTELAGSATEEDAVRSRVRFRTVLAVLAMVLAMVTLPASALADARRARGCTIIGTDQDDELHGTPGPDVIYGGPGQDLLDGGPGADTIRSEGGRDGVFGEDVGGPGGDSCLSAIDGRPGDRVRGGPGNDRGDADPGDHLRSVETVVDYVCFGG